MTDKASGRPPGGPSDAGGEEPGVLGSLPTARPSRLGRQGRDAVSAGRAAKGPKAVRPGAPSLDTPQSGPPPDAEERPTPPSGTELLTTAVRATGELAQIGVTLAGQLARRILRGLPRL